jgi:hypothetical protein
MICKFITLKQMCANVSQRLILALFHVWVESEGGCDRRHNMTVANSEVEYACMLPEWSPGFISAAAGIGSL